MSINNSLRNQILRMARLDQSLRKKQWREYKTMNKKFPNKSAPKYKEKINEFANQLKKLDSEHTEKMRGIIKRFGWQGKGLVGKRGAQTAWLLVQHADYDTRFQEWCLNFLKGAVSREEAEPRHIAFLTDRILTHQNKKQVYGTQFRTGKNGKLVPFPIKDIKKLDKRRKEMGLESFYVYTKKMKGYL